MLKLTNKIKILIVSLACISVLIISIYFHLLGIDKVFPHFYYLPILLLACWWGYAGWYLGILFALTLPAIHITSGIDEPVLSDIIRAAVMCVVSLVVAGGVEKYKKSEKRYREFFSTSRECMFSTSKDGKWTDMNDDAPKLFGYESKDELMKTKIPELCEDPEERGRHVQKIEQQGFVKDFSVNLRKKDGSIMNTLITSVARRDGKGNVTGFQGTIRDITERKLAEEALRQEKDKAQRYLDIAGVVLVAIDADQNTSLINRKGCEVLGYKQEEIIGRNWFDITVSEKDRSEVRDVFTRLIAGEIEPVECYENPVLTKSGEERIIAWHNTVLHDEKDNIIGTLSSGEDITERKKAENALRESVEHYRLLAENITDVIWTMDMNLRFTYMSPSVTRQLGYSVEEMLNITLEKIMTPASLEAATKALEEELTIEDMEQKDLSRSRALEIEEYCKDGSTVWLEATMTGLRDPDGRFIGILGVSRDITERKEAEKALEQAKIHFEALFEHANEMILTVDAKGYIYGINKMVEDTTGYSRQELTGKSALIFAPDEDRSDYIKFWKDVLKGGSPRYELRMLTRDKKLIHVLSSGSVIRKGGQVTEIQCNIQDITKRKQAEERLKQTNKELQIALNELREIQARLIQQEKMASIGHLAAGMAHEINNPLGFINSNLNTFKRYMEYTKGFLGFVKESTLNISSTEKKGIEDAWAKNKMDIVLEDVDDLLSESMDGTGRIREIVANLKEFSHIDRPDLTSFSLNAMLDTVVSIVKRNSSDHIDIVKDYGDIPLVDGYGAQLSQAFMAILENAVWAIEGSGTVTIKTKGAKDSVRIIISDTGRGIPEEVLSKIFDPFFTTKDVGRGKGLGLNTAYRTVSSHGGKIDTKTKVGKGTIFTITLPVRYVEEGRETVGSKE